jgi:cellulose synthase/poly-beta-1,6-N-acetylglucosamine synthase-like glycosyltransferase
MTPATSAAPCRETFRAEFPAGERVARAAPRAGPRPQLYLFVIGSWILALIWFHLRLTVLLALADGPVSYGALLFFIIFVELAWLNGLYNIGIIVFRYIYRWRTRSLTAPPVGELPPVALLYTTCNDFIEASAASCLIQDYPEFTLYLLDDSTDPEYRARVDHFAEGAGGRVQVVRRPDRRGFKAGNINHALASATAGEPIFALVDADEILPPDFLRRTVAHLMADRECGFVQANHRSNPEVTGSFPADLGVGIDIHWRWYQPVRNHFGFVMLLGHGAVIRRQCWEEVGGFPEVVSEDLAFALRIRERGWRGYFAEDVVCYEEFPQTVRAFRIRHMKWTRGTCELFRTEFIPMLRSSRITLIEKLDIIFPTAGLPLALFYLLFMINTNLVLVWLFGHPAEVTLSLAGREFVFPFLRIDDGFRAIMAPDFFVITLLTIISPVLCFIIELATRPGQLFRFLGRSTVIYSTLAPLSALGVLTYFFTGHATFLVTGDQSERAVAGGGIRERIRQFFMRSHPDDPAVQAFEILCGIVFGVGCVLFFQISFLGLALGFILLPILHHADWTHPLIRRLVFLPALLILTGLAFSGLSLFGVQPLFFGYGFHF